MKLRRLIARAAFAALLVLSPAAAHAQQSSAGPTPPAGAAPAPAPLGGCVYMPNGVALTGYVGPMGLTCGSNGGLNVNVLSGGSGGGTANPYPASDYAKDGTDNTGVSQPSSGTGIRGWLSAIYTKIAGTLNVANTPATGATMTNAQPSCTTTATSISAAGAYNHREFINPPSNTAAAFYGGSSSITTATGTPVYPGTSSGDMSRYSGAIYIVCASTQPTAFVAY